MEKQVEEHYAKAGEIAASALAFGASLIKPGMSMREVLDKVEEKIIASGGNIAFPAQSAANHIAAHFCPTDDDDYLYKEGDLVKLDVGVHVEGYVADNALTVDLGSGTELRKASLDALQAALTLATPGTKLRELGKAIQEAIESYGYSPIRNLSGHGLGLFKIHTKPTVPNFDNGDETELQEDQVIAIEPFATNGKGMVGESANPSIFMLIAQKPVRSSITRSVLPSILKWKGLPFTTRWVTREHGVGKTSFALRELMQRGNLQAFAPLPEVAGGLVAQSEKSVIVRDKPYVYTSTT
ncbi:MAG: type II methionyl aminopeptidase [Candidatus Woesearchaeota archaeon]|nr:MAG: type II methionyl aminopeptidase [Candidatus Woesearchaeota archaeon]